MFNDDYEERRERRRKYQGDVTYDVWRAGGNVDRIDRDRVEQSYYDGRDYESAARIELNAQRQRERPESEEEHYVRQMQEQYEQEQQPDQCCECDQQAVGYSEGQPWCAEHYRSRTSLHRPPDSTDGGR